MRAVAADGVVATAVEAAERDAATLGLVLLGSRAGGAAADGDDYDLLRVVADDRGADAEEWFTADDRISLVSLRLGEFEELASEQGWWSYGLASGRVLVDKTQTIAAAIARSAALAPDGATAVAAEAYDAYLHVFVRSLRSHARGDVLGERLHAAQSVIHLAKALFALENRPAPYNDRLRGELDSLAAQGWPPGYLAAELDRIVTTGDPDAQRRLQQRVEQVMEARGVATPEKWKTRLGGHAPPR